MKTEIDTFEEKIMTIFGTRPEAIKMAPLVKAIENDNQLEVCSRYSTT